MASALRRARAITPVMKLRLVSSTRPSGTMATAAATVAWSASRHTIVSSLSWRSSNNTDAGGMMNVSQRRMMLTPRRSSLPASSKRRASSESLAA